MATNDRPLFEKQSMHHTFIEFIGGLEKDKRE